jgi:transcriptional regulator with XRE-family HTH domain
MAKREKIHNSTTPRRIHFISEWIEHRGLQQSDVAEALGTNKGTVSKWCSGALPSETNLLALASLLEVEPPDLFRHPYDDWMARLFRNRSEEELARMVNMLKAAFPSAEGANGKKFGKK